MWNSNDSLYRGDASKLLVESVENEIEIFDWNWKIDTATEVIVSTRTTDFELTKIITIIKKTAEKNDAHSQHHQTQRNNETWVQSTDGASELEHV